MTEAEARSELGSTFALLCAAIAKGQGFSLCTISERGVLHIEWLCDPRSNPDADDE